MLIVLDNAGSVAQVRPLLPGNPACAVVVTSRDALAGLVARDGATRLNLDLLPPQEAVGLLGKLIGQRVAADPSAAATLAAQCSRLPLALRVAAELAAARPAAPLADLVTELADQQRRLDLLDASGDPHSAVRAVFSWSYRHLDAAAARAFRLAGLHPGPNISPGAMAALTGTRPEQAHLLIDRLAGAHLVQRAGASRYSLHDLLRAYAHDLATGTDSEADRRAALARLFDYYLHTAAAAMDTLVPAEQDRRPRVPPPGTAAPPMESATAARARLDAERDNLVAAAAYMAGHGWPGHATQLSATLFRYLDTGGHHHDAVTVHTDALHAARRASDRGSEAAALLSLGGACWRLGRLDEADRHLAQALDIFQATGDRPGQARTLGNLGIVQSCHGHHERAAGYHRQALAIFRAAGDQLGQARTLETLGSLLADQRQFQQAREHHEAALGIFRQLDERHGESNALCGLGVTEWWQGRYPEASGHLQASLAVFRDLGDRLGQASALSNLAIVEWWQGRYNESAERQEQAIALYREIGDGPGEAGALNAYGDALCAAGRLAQARAAHTEALSLATQLGDRYQQARAHDGLGFTHQASGEAGQARGHWRHALAGYASVGAAEAADVRARLGDVHGDQDHSPASTAGGTDSRPHEPARAR
jgi:tetratricopeptide (TPR) repeat protein